MCNAVRVMLLFLIVFLSFSLLNIWYCICKCKEPKKGQHTRYFSVFLTWGTCCLVDLMISPQAAVCGALHRLLIVLPFPLPGVQFPYSYLFIEFKQEDLVLQNSISQSGSWIADDYWHTKFSFWSSICVLFFSSLAHFPGYFVSCGKRIYIF